MAASVNPILPSKQPLKTLNRSPKFLRNGYNMKNNAAKRKSAVELLQESKAYYVKSEQVLDTKQELKHTEHLQVSSHPSYNNLLRHPLRTSHGWDAPSSSSSSSTALPPRGPEHKASGAGIEPKLLTVTLLGYSPRLHVQRNSTGGGSFRISASQVASGSTSKAVAVSSVSVSVPVTTPSSNSAPASVAIRRQVSRSLSAAGQTSATMCQQQPQRPASQLGIGQEPSQLKNILPPKSPRAPHLRSKTQPEMPFPPPRPHEYRRSHSEKDNSNDIQMKLRRLLNTDSKENLNTSLHSDAGSNHVLINNNHHHRLTNGEPLRMLGNEDCPATPVTSDFCNNQEEPFIKPRHQQEGNYCIHKSMPDLSPMQVGLMRRLSANGSDDDSLHLRAPKSVDVKPPSWTTSDYVSRSPSSRKECFSEKAACEQDDISSRLGRSTDGRMDEDDDSITAMDTGRLSHIIEPGGGLVAGIRRRPILRSKSDISHRYSKSGTDLSNTGSPKRSSRAGAELERFFDTMGLDSSILYVLKTPPSDSSSPIFFNSVSTGNSSCCCHGGATCEGSHQESCDADDESNANAVTETSGAAGAPALPCRDGITNKDLMLHGPVETSIVERNARVIKWLFNCRKIQSSGEGGAVKRPEM